MVIQRTHRLPAGEFFEERYPKDLVVIHHTVSGSFQSVWGYWNGDRNKDGSRRRVATAFVIDKDGTTYELFDPSCWAHHIGSPLVGNQAANQRSVGIELVSEGALRLIDGRLFWMDGQIPYRSNTALVHKTDEPWRGYQYFDGYEEAQMTALEELLQELVPAFGIPRKMLPALDRTGYRPDLLRGWTGILGHCNLRPDKTDPHPGFDWKRIEKALA